MKRHYIYHKANTFELIESIKDQVKLIVEDSGYSSFRYINKLYFASLDKALGLYSPSDDVIYLNNKLLDYNQAEYLVQVALHEVAHQIDYKLNGKLAHQASFKDICQRLGVSSDFSKTKVDLSQGDKIINKIKKLEALSNSEFSAESEAALMKVADLVKKYGISQDGQSSTLASCELYTYNVNAPTYIVYLISMVALIVNFYVVKTDSLTAGKRAFTVYADDEQTLEIVCYIFDQLYVKIESSFKEKKKENKELYKGHNAKISYYRGIYLSLKTRFAKDSTKALVVSNNYKNKVSEYLQIRLRTVPQSKIRVNAQATEAGKIYGKNLEINKGLNLNAIKLIK